MYCVHPKHEELKGKNNTATHLVTVRRKPPKSEQYLMVVCEACAGRLCHVRPCNVEWWDRVPRTDSGVPWIHMVVTEIS